MANRLSRIVTRTGDDGSTGLGDGSRVRKDDLRVRALGEVDELNSTLGLLLTEPLPDAASTMLLRMQNDLFDLGGELCIPGYTLVQETQVEALDEAIATLNAELKPLKEFILPGGNRAAALAHLARTVARRAERSVVALAAAEPVRPIALHYLNRASDLLFVMGRWLNMKAGGRDVLWQRTAASTTPRA